MKLCIYQADLNVIHRQCIRSLSASGYRVELHDIPKGYTHAIKECDIPSHYSLIDLRVIREKQAVAVSIFSCYLSATNGTFHYNRIGEQSFIEHFLGELGKDARNKFEMAAGGAEFA